MDIYATFDWLEHDTKIGVLGCETLRGVPTYQFAYDANWLRSYRHLVLSKDAPAVAGWHYKKGIIFDFLQDALPDRWGRKLLDKRERMMAEGEQRLPHRLSDVDYLLQLDDITRMGALRLGENGQMVGVPDTDYSVPPVAQIREFIDLALAFEKSELEGTTLREQWLRNLYRQGSSLGGARPKANVRDVDGTLYIAKIPSIHDDYDIALWEYFACCLAREAGINVAPTRLLSLDGMHYHTLLTRRFDRDGDKRVHFASAMTLCGLEDGADADSGNGYLDIVEMLVGNSGVVNVEESLCELYRRVAFNCLIGNHDDHFRNHGFLLTPKGWIWSPAYDLNPTSMTTQSLLINRNSNASDIRLLEASAADYLLTPDQAHAIITQVQHAVRDWRRVATRCGISVSEQSRFPFDLRS